MPVEWVTDERIKKFTWPSDGSAGTAALMLFFVFCHFSSERIARARRSAEPVSAGVAPGDANPYSAHLVVTPATGFSAGALALVGVQLPEQVRVQMVAHLTYDELSALTGLSRKLISGGLKLLETRKMVTRYGSARTGDYCLEGLEEGKRWAKLPGQALLSPAKTEFLPLTRFSLRSKHELNALKLHLYYASVRDRTKPYSQSSFETTWNNIGVPERDIPKANSLLLSTGLLSRFGRDTGEDAKQYESNRYYMEGYDSLLARTTPPASTDS
jgi:hypothetical protein